MAKDKEGFEALIPFFMPEKANMAIRMRVSANGEVYISKKIIDSVRKENENMWVDFRHSEDYRTLAIRPGVQSGFRLPKTGTMKFHALRDILVMQCRHGIFSSGIRSKKRGWASCRMYRKRL